MDVKVTRMEIKNVKIGSLREVNIKIDSLKVVIMTKGFMLIYQNSQEKKKTD
jgi:hypothetical protein